MSNKRMKTAEPKLLHSTYMDSSQLASSYFEPNALEIVEASTDIVKRMSDSWRTLPASEQLIIRPTPNAELRRIRFGKAMEKASNIIGVILGVVLSVLMTHSC